MKTTGTILALLFPALVVAEDGIGKGGAKFRVDVDRVVLEFSVRDDGGGHVKGLTPRDLRVFEDGVEQNITYFSEAIEAARGRKRSIFVVFDTSNRMYEQFSRAQDAVVNLLRRLPEGDATAVHAFSRNIQAPSPLSTDRFQSIQRLRRSVAGAETALYNSLLLTVRQAERLPGEKRIVAFSNGGDNASVISPDDVARVARDAGVVIDIVSTVGEDEISRHAFRRLAEQTGGKAYFAHNWKGLGEAFETISEELRNTYVITYRPGPNTNIGFRRLEVKLNGKLAKDCEVRARPGYRPREQGPMHATARRYPPSSD